MLEADFSQGDLRSGRIGLRPYQAMITGHPMSGGSTLRLYHHRRLSRMRSA